MPDGRPAHPAKPGERHAGAHFKRGERSRARNPPARPDSIGECGFIQLVRLGMMVVNTNP